MQWMDEHPLLEDFKSSYACCGGLRASSYAHERMPVLQIVVTVWNLTKTMVGDGSYLC
jgi:hypothetical protein